MNKETKKRLGAADSFPDCPNIDHCHCFPEVEREANAKGQTHCVCSPTDKVLRGYISGRIKKPMNDRQRQWCYRVISESGGGKQYEDLRTLGDDLISIEALAAFMGIEI